MIELTQDNFNKFLSESELPVMVEFGAEWCVPCKRLEPELEKLASQWQNKMVLGHINVDQDADIAAQYMVMGVPTVILIKDGELKERVTGYKSLQSLMDIFGLYLD
ncbi:MAG: hypothetical protein BGO78_08705 [Chloroflexi bacterium 44-23]|nr:MAG: hypothetical protein BGO78_08705 [Chloroflexi bacterium 44-23]